jgi:hypothetical protein
MNDAALGRVPGMVNMGVLTVAKQAIAWLLIFGD